MHTAGVARHQLQRWACVQARLDVNIRVASVLPGRRNRQPDGAALHVSAGAFCGYACCCFEVALVLGGVPVCVCVIHRPVSVLLTELLGALYGGWQGAFLDVAVWHAAGVDRPADGAV